MHSWGKQVKVAFKSQIDLCQKEMEICREATYEQVTNRYGIARRKLNNLIAQEDAYQRQRAKVYWLKDEDINTKFFHSFATTRSKIKKIISLTCDNGMVVKDHNNICNVSYFDIFFVVLKLKFMK